MDGLMNEDKTIDIFLSMKESLARIDANLTNCLTRLENHEQRLQKIEGGSGDGFKEEMMKTGGKCLTIALIIIASLTGAAGILSKMFNIGQ